MLLVMVVVVQFCGAKNANAGNRNRSTKRVVVVAAPLAENRSDCEWCG